MIAPRFTDYSCFKTQKCDFYVFSHDINFTE